MADRAAGETLKANGTGAAATRRVSTIVRLPVIPVAATVMVSTTIPTGSPLGFRVHCTLPLPVPAATVSVVDGRRFVALHPTVSAPVPVTVTAAWPAIGVVVPTTAVAVVVTGVTSRASGTGTAVIIRVSYSRNGEPLAPGAVTVMVSTNSPTPSPVMVRFQRAIPLPLPAEVTSDVQP